MKTRALEFLLVVASVVFALGLSEAALRFVSPSKYHVWPPGLGYTFRPSPEIMPGIEGDSRFSINDEGLRGDPFSNGEAYRILAIGGSTTECLYLDDAEAWPYLLQTTLTAMVGSTQRIWVGNAGMSGRNTRNHIMQVERLIEQYPAIDAILVLVGANDFLGRLSSGAQYDSFPDIDMLTPQEYAALMSRSFSKWPGWDSRFPFFKRTEIWHRLSRMKSRYLAPLQDNLAPIQDSVGSIYQQWRLHRQTTPSMVSTLPDLSAALREYRRNIMQIVETANGQGVRTILVTQPYLWRSGLSKEEQNLLWMGGVGNYQSEEGHEYYAVDALASGMKMYNEVLLRVCHDDHVECIDLDSQLLKDTSVFYDDLHFNEHGARRVAAILAGYLFERAPIGRNARSTPAPIADGNLTARAASSRHAAQSRGVLSRIRPAPLPR